MRLFLREGDRLRNQDRALFILDSRMAANAEPEELRRAIDRLME
jgi:hypothetical protein